MSPLKLKADIAEGNRLIASRMLDRAGIQEYRSEFLQLLVPCVAKVDLTAPDAREQLEELMGLFIECDEVAVLNYEIAALRFQNELQESWASELEDEMNAMEKN